MALCSLARAAPARAARAAAPPPRRAAVVARAQLAAGAAGAAAALLLAASPLAAPPPARAAPTEACVLAEGGGDSLLDRIKAALPKRVEEDPFAAERKQARTVGDTQRPIEIITEQEAVVTEAFPNPSEALSPKPPVLAAAEGDEQRGGNAGQFEGVDASSRQALIDAKSPEQAARR
ncbi:hypothetical protein HT031_000934 [Scenedesmus sp. PABB004]|nr:hypothetical protein HT031_000934 [Scenedesmus sp. PABB004]